MVVHSRHCGSKSAAGPRLAWLDALRAVAAMVVVIYHAGFYYASGPRQEVLKWIDPGISAVMVLFLVSGYVIPATLERGRSLRTFWIGRIFRLYPLLIVALVPVFLLASTGTAAVRSGHEPVEPWVSALANVTLLQEMTAVPSSIIVLWTLSYEIAFYLLVSAFFATGMHRHYTVISGSLAVTGLVLGALLPAALLSRTVGIAPMVVITAVVLVVAIACAAAGRRSAVRTGGAMLGGALATVLVLFNSKLPWQSLIILAVMCTGTVIYQAERHRVRRRTAIVVSSVVLGCAMITGVWHYARQGLAPATEFAQQRSWILAMLLAAVAFAGGLALRHRRMPKWLVELGVISYSVYLLHPLLLSTLERFIGKPSHDRPSLIAAFLVVLVPISWLSYRIIEQPAQRLGRRLARRVGGSTGTLRHPGEQQDECADGADIQRQVGVVGAAVELGPAVVLVEELGRGPGGGRPGR